MPSLTAPAQGVHTPLSQIDKGSVHGLIHIIGIVTGLQHSTRNKDGVQLALTNVQIADETMPGGIEMSLWRNNSTWSDVNLRRGCLLSCSHVVRKQNGDFPAYLALSRNSRLRLLLPEGDAQDQSEFRSIAPSGIHNKCTPALSRRGKDLTAWWDKLNQVQDIVRAAPALRNESSFSEKSHTKTFLYANSCESTEFQNYVTRA